MKIDRQIGIITALQRNKTVTASYLAEKFEVSRRTIIRDIEDICKAGIPLVTRILLENSGLPLIFLPEKPSSENSETMVIS